MKILVSKKKVRGMEVEMLKQVQHDGIYFLHINKELPQSSP